MHKLFPDHPELLRATLEIAERCNLQLELGKLIFPEFTVPEGHTPDSYLQKLSLTGALKRHHSFTPEVRSRLMRELEVIKKWGLAPYFLLVLDIVEEARRRGIPALARGSAANMRRDFLHKFTTKISKNHAEIFVENLNVKGMVQNRHLSRAIHDVGWSELRRQLEYKSLLNGSVLTVRDPFYASSKTCSQCGYVMEVLPLSVREWTCPACQTTHDRDVNAAINLKQNTVGYTGINAWGQEGSGLAGTASETGLVEPGTLPWVNTHFHSQER